MTDPRAVLSLDLATATGWALWAPGLDAPRSGTVKLPRTGEDVGRFLRAFDEWLRDFISLERPWRLVFEAPILTTGKTDITTARKLMCLAGVAEMVAHRAGIPCYEQRIAEVRKHFVGHGNLRRDAAKRAVLDACRARGWQPRDDNAADALALLDYVVHLWRLDVPWQPGVMFHAPQPGANSRGGRR